MKEEDWDVDTIPCGGSCRCCEEPTKDQLTELSFSKSALSLRTPLAFAEIDEIGSNEDEWEVETLPEIGFHELGGES